MKVAVIGCGSIGRRHISNFLKNDCEVIAYNRSNQRRNFVKDKYKIKTFDDLNKIVKCQPDLAVICSPNKFHLEQSIFFAQNSVHLFIEKPLCLIDQDLKKLKSIIKKNKIITHVGCNLRFNYGILELRKLIKKNIIGKILNAEFNTGMYLPDWHPNEDYKKMYSSKKKLGGGVLMDMIHEIDLSIWLFKNPIYIASIIKNTKTLKINTEDFINIIMSYKNNLTVSMNLNYIEKPHRRTIRLIGAKGILDLDLIKKQLVICQGNKMKKIKFPKYIDHNNMYMEQNRYVIKQIIQRKKSINNVSIAEKTIALAKKINNNNLSFKLMKKNV